jgi:hypothetical protein
VSSIVLQIPEELKLLCAPIEALLRAVASRVERARQGCCETAVMEQEFTALTAAIECAAHAPVLAALDLDAPLVAVDGVPHRLVLRSPLTVYTPAGAVSVMRSLYRPCGAQAGPTFDPVARRAGLLDDGWMPHTAAAVAFLVQMGTSRESAAIARQMGRLPYDRSTFERVTHQVGERLVDNHAEVEQRLIETFEVPAEAKTVSVSLDRVSLRMEEPRPRPVGRPPKNAPKRYVQAVWRMAWCATVTLHDAEGRALHTIRYGRMPAGDVTTLVEGLCDDVLALRAMRPDLRVVLLCDGGADLWKLLRAQLTPATLETEVHEVVDVWHAIEKLGAAARAHLGPAGAAAVVSRWKLKLLNRPGAAEKILKEILAWDDEWARVGEEHPVHEAITYLQNHGTQMHYAEARAKGLPIGSGNVEATCKSLFEVRMKRPGARWHEATGEHIVHLRALALSDRWESAMGRLLRNEPAHVEELPCAA